MYKKAICIYLNVSKPIRGLSGPEMRLGRPMCSVPQGLIDIPRVINKRHHFCGFVTNFKSARFVFPCIFVCSKRSILQR